jgi:two-component system response regulator
LILLDLNLPGTDGREVLEEIKNDPKLRTIPVIVLTTSSDGEDIEKCYRAGANSYIQKPVDLDGFFAAIQRLKNFWFEVALLPKHELTP